MRPFPERKKKKCVVARKFLGGLELDNDFLFFYCILSSLVFIVTYFYVSFSSQVNRLYCTYSSHSVAKDEKTRKKQETTRKPAFYTCERLTHNVNTEPLRLTSHFFLFLSKRRNHCINMCDSQAMFSVTCNFNTFFLSFSSFLQYFANL